MIDASASVRRWSGWLLAQVFAVVGALFVLFPAGVLRFFNSFSRPLGLPAGPETGPQFYLVLAGAYMGVVTLLAWRMARDPGQKIYPALLAQAKLASALLSFAFFALQRPLLIYLANGLVDGAIGLWALALARSAGRR